MLVEKNVQGAFLDAPDIQWSGTGLRTCQGVCERLCECSAVCHCHSSQFPAPSLALGSTFPAMAVSLQLLLALTALPSRAGEIIIKFFSLSQDAEPRENQSWTPGNFKISKSQSE